MKKPPLFKCQPLPNMIKTLEAFKREFLPKPSLIYYPFPLMDSALTKDGIFVYRLIDTSPSSVFSESRVIYLHKSKFITNALKESGYEAKTKSLKIFRESSYANIADIILVTNLSASVRPKIVKKDGFVLSLSFFTSRRLINSSNFLRKNYLKRSKFVFRGAIVLSNNFPVFIKNSKEELTIKEFTLNFGSFPSFCLYIFQVKK